MKNDELPVRGDDGSEARAVGRTLSGGCGNDRALPVGLVDHLNLRKAVGQGFVGHDLSVQAGAGTSVMMRSGRAIHLDG